MKLLCLLISLGKNLQQHTLHSGTSLTLTSATSSSDDMYCVYLGKAVQTVNPASGSVGASQLASDAVTAAKLNDDIISGQTALGATPADTDEFLISDAGTLKRVDYSYIKGATCTPAFQARDNDNSGQTISNATGTVVEFGAETFDIGGCYDVSNNKFVCPSGEGGKYFFYFNVGYTNPNSTGHRIMYLQTAGSGGSFSAVHEFQLNGSIYASSGANVWQGSALVDMNEGEEARLEVYQTSGGNLSLNPVSGQNLFFWWI